MNSSKKILTFILTLILYSCADYNSKVSNQDKNKQYYSSNGFALIYDENYYQNKIYSLKLKSMRQGTLTAGVVRDTQKKEKRKEGERGRREK